MFYLQVDLSLNQISLDVLLFLAGKLDLAGPYAIKSSMIFANCCKVSFLLPFFLLVYNKQLYIMLACIHGISFKRKCSLNLSNYRGNQVCVGLVFLFNRRMLLENLCEETLCSWNLFKEIRLGSVWLFLVFRILLLLT